MRCEITKKVQADRLCHKLFAIALLVLIAALAVGTVSGAAESAASEKSVAAPDILSENIRTNVKTDFAPAVFSPRLKEGVFIDPAAVVIGDVTIGKEVFVGPTAVIRGDEGTPIFIGDFSNVQDGVIIHALETTLNGKNIDGRRFTKAGARLAATDPLFKNGYAVYIGQRTSCAHGTQVHGPAWVGDDTFIGMETIIFNAKVGNKVAIGVASTITGGVEIADGRYVPPGSVIDTQAKADALGPAEGSPYGTTNIAVVHVNEKLSAGYEAAMIAEENAGSGFGSILSGIVMNPLTICVLFIIALLAVLAVFLKLNRKMAENQKVMDELKTSLENLNKK